MRMHIENYLSCQEIPIGKDIGHPVMGPVMVPVTAIETVKTVVI